MVVLCVCVCVCTNCINVMLADRSNVIALSFFSYVLRTHVIILDDLSHVSVPSVLAELLTSLSYRTPSHPMWVSNVYDREGTLLYPCGLYYLKEGSYFIATKTVAR